MGLEKEMYTCKNSRQGCSFEVDGGAADPILGRSDDQKGGKTIPGIRLHTAVAALGFKLNPSMNGCHWQKEKISIPSSIVHASQHHRQQSCIYDSRTLVNVQEELELTCFQTRSRPGSCSSHHSRTGDHKSPQNPILWSFQSFAPPL